MRRVYRILEWCISQNSAFPENNEYSPRTLQDECACDALQAFDSAASGRHSYSIQNSSWEAMETCRYTRCCVVKILAFPASEPATKALFDSTCSGNSQLSYAVIIIYSILQPKTERSLETHVITPVQISRFPGRLAMRT